MQATLTVPVSRPIVRVDRPTPRPRPETVRRPIAPRQRAAELELRPEAGGSLQRWLDLCG